MRGAIALALALALGGAGSAAAIEAGDFRAEVEGWTIHYRLGPDYYGSERYLEGDRVIWRDSAGQCLRGRWMALGGAICFSYEDAPEEALCWEVERGPEGLSARVAGSEGEPLREASRLRGGALDCPGPDVGV